MKSARSVTKLLMCGVGVAALVSSCTIETTSGDGDTGGTSSTTGGTSSTTGGTSSTTGGTSGTTGGVTTGGASEIGGAGGEAQGGAGGEAQGGAGGNSAGQGGAGASDAGGQGGASFDRCDTCLDAQCTTEFDACVADPSCISEDVDGSGQFEQIVQCVDMARTMLAVRRIELRDCGTAVGTGPDWPPIGMNEATRDLVNCMATGVTGEAMNDSWANSQNVSNPWAATSCARLACTSRL